MARMTTTIATSGTLVAGKYIGRGWNGGLGTHPYLDGETACLCMRLRRVRLAGAQRRGRALVRAWGSTHDRRDCKDKECVE